MDTRVRGLALMELLLAMLMGAVLLAGMMQIAAGARSNFRLQEALAEVQENGRFVIDTIGGLLRQSDFDPEPWSEDRASTGFTTESGDEVSRNGDRLAFRTWSERNCFGNANQAADNTGLPVFFLKEIVLELNARDLIQTCRYGPDEGQFTTQLRRQGLVRNAEAFQVLYAEDTDEDGMADSWVPGGQWNNQSRIVGLQIDILLSSSEAVATPAEEIHNVLDRIVITPADGRLRRVFTYTQALRAHRQ